MRTYGQQMKEWLTNLSTDRRLCVALAACMATHAHRVIAKTHSPLCETGFEKTALYLPDTSLSLFLRHDVKSSIICHEVVKTLPTDGSRHHLLTLSLSVTSSIIITCVSP